MSKYFGPGSHDRGSVQPNAVSWVLPTEADSADTLVDLSCLIDPRRLIDPPGALADQVKPIGAVLADDTVRALQALGGSLNAWLFAALAVWWARATGRDAITMTAVQGAPTPACHCFQLVLTDVKSGHMAFEAAAEALGILRSPGARPTTGSLPEPGGQVAANLGRLALHLPPQGPSAPERQPGWEFLVWLDTEGGAGYVDWPHPRRNDLALRGFIRGWLQLAVAMSQAPSRALDQWPLVDRDESLRLLALGLGPQVGTGAPFDPSFDHAHHQFERQVLLRPDAVATQDSNRLYSYQQLNRRANRVAHALIRCGIRPDDRVAICVGRSVDAVVALLGVLKSGAGYVPIDPDYPAERIEFMLGDCSPSAALVDLSTYGRIRGLGSVPQHCQIDLGALSASDNADDDRNPDPAEIGLDGSRLAYVIYTSGSTGKPKGAAIEHAGLSNMLAWYAQDHAIAASDRSMVVTSLSFDLTQKNLLAPLLRGGQVHLADPEFDPAAIVQAMQARAITILNLTPSYFSALVDAEAARVGAFASLRRVFLGGEPIAVSRFLNLEARYPDLTVVNSYGPTECTDVVSDHALQRPWAQYVSSAPPLGRPIRNTCLLLLDDTLQPVPQGSVGEIWVAGIGVSRGYLGRPDITAERFVVNPFASIPGDRLYRTGDLGRWSSAGELEYLGRNDHQVKVRGFRVELGEVETVLGACAGVSQVAVVASAPRDTEPGGDMRLLAYVSAQQGALLDGAALRRQLAAFLPDHMVPSICIVLPSLPLTASGKIDRSALPKRSSARPALPVPFQSAVGETEQAICEVFAAALDIDEVGRDDNFFDLGGTSLGIVSAAAQLSTRRGLRVSATALFTHASARLLAASLQARQPLPAPADANAGEREQASGSVQGRIAIIGMAGRFPGAMTVQAFWQNLLDGRDSITEFTIDTLDAGIPASLRADPSYVRARGILQDVECFDNEFFGVSAREAEVMDPQHRLFLECAWETLESAGYAPDASPGRVGVFAGVHAPTYLQRHVLAHPEAIDRVGEFQVLLGNDKDYAALRVAHKLGLRGPALAVNTTCSTSLVAIVQAMDSLRLGRCEMALAGGASVTAPYRSGYLYNDGSMLSEDGHTRPFDARGTGTAFNDGVACVLLKPLAAALADGDPIHAVLRGGAVNNDGAGKASFSAPSAEGQAAVITQAIADAGVDPRDISYVEAHGTATPLGDPIEIEALTEAYRRFTPDVGFCSIGSLKSNVGHLVTAAGAAGVIKAALALQEQVLPATIHFETANPKIAFEGSPFVVAHKQTPWPRGDKPRLAGVSSFGVGGTNAHVILEEAPEQAPSAPCVGPQLLRLSARSRGSLEAVAIQMAGFLDSQPDINLADLAFTLDKGRSRFTQRMCVVAATAGQAAAALRGAPASRRTLREQPSAAPAQVWLFPGQGSQYGGMGRELYAADANFRASLDECFEALQGELPFDLKARMFAEDAAGLQATQATQPATFCIEVALARTWLARGAQPTALVGHSVGEFAAAVIAGVMSLADAARLVARRGLLMQDMPGGAMLSVRMAAPELATLLPAGVTVAGYNAPSVTVVAGESAAIKALRDELERRGVASRVLQTSHAFHSPMMDAAVAPFRQSMADVSLSAPRIPIASTVTGAWLDAAQATDVSYWADHLREPVRFAPALITALTRHANATLIEIGPRDALTSLARMQITDLKLPATAVASLAADANDEVAGLMSAIGQLWTLGIELEASAASQQPRRRRLSLPTYAFERKPHWLEMVAPAPHATATPATGTAERPMPAAAAASALPAMTAPLAVLADRRQRLLTQLRELFADIAGLDLEDADAQAPFVELGLDSLTLTQVALQIKRKFAVAVSFRQLMQTHRSFDALADLLDRQMPPEQGPIANVAAPPTSSDRSHAQDQTGYDAKKAFGAIARIHTQAAPLSGLQRTRLDAFVRRYTEKTAKSKAYTAAHRPRLADPRVVNGFRPMTKEITYQIVIERSKGARVWDIDGNEYVDALCGFGMNLFGWQPDFVLDAVRRQLDLGFEIGPQHPLAGEVAQLVCELTGHDRAALCNTGSEAVMAAVRIARTVTGRSTLVLFSGAYHGTFDEVVVRAGRGGAGIPAAPGILRGAFGDVRVLDYASPEALTFIREHGQDIAAVLVEPVQSRRPDLQPREFLAELRELTKASGACLIFDEVITGFRAHPGGVQALFGIQADLATYGKVIGGGMPIGVVAGQRDYMDALDGGTWQFGDASIPSVGVTYFAGTFVRHPLALAAAKASLLHLKQRGESLQRDLNLHTAAMADELTAHCREVGAPIAIRHFASLWRVAWLEDHPLQDLLFAMMRSRGVHILDNFPCFMTTAHTAADIATIKAAFKESLAELQAAEFLPRRCESARFADASTPPVPEARLGRDKDGQPTWYVPDPARPGKFAKLEG